MTFGDQEPHVQYVYSHLRQMADRSRKQWPPIVEVDGFRIIEDHAYQGFDNDGNGPSHPWWPEPRFFCRSITVEHIESGARATGRGPQADAYASAVRQIEESL